MRNLEKAVDRMTDKEVYETLTQELNHAIFLDFELGEIKFVANMHKSPAPAKELFKGKNIIFQDFENLHTMDLIKYCRDHLLTKLKG